MFSNFSKEQQIIEYISKIPIKEILIIIGITFVFISTKSISENKEISEETERLILRTVGVTLIIVGIKLIFFF